MVGVTRRSLIAGFSVDPTRVLDATRAVRMRLKPDSVVRLRTKGGSDLTVKLSPKHRWAEHVGVIRPGRWENLPTGELVTAPHSVDGVFVCDASLGGHFDHKGLVDRNPVRVEVSQCAVTRVSCSDRTLQRLVEEYLRSEPMAARVGTVVIGTNVGMLAPIGEMVADQNLPGLHLSLGNTFPDMTGAEPGALSQLTMTTSGADLDLDGAQLLRAGRYLV
jgi:leucyl aminopeptidase (aminopeptidase T)